MEFSDIDAVILRLSARSTLSGDTIEDWLTKISGPLKALAHAKSVELPPSFLPRIVNREDDESRSTFYVTLVEAAPELVLGVDGEQLKFHSETLFVGTGFHQAVTLIADLLQKDFALTWVYESDPANFAERRDIAALAELFSSVVLDLSKTLVETSSSSDLTEGFAVLMPEYPMYTFEGFALTPVGIRDRNFFEGIANGVRTPSEIFLWPIGKPLGEVEFDLLMYRLRFLTRFRQPLDDAEAKEILSLLEGFEKCGHPDTPWDALAELYAFAGRESLFATRAQMRAATVTALPDSVAFLRHPVRELLSGGWSVSIPGDMKGSWDEQSYTATNGGMTLIFSSITLMEPSDEIERFDGEIGFEAEGLSGAAKIVKGDDGWTMEAIAQAETQVALGTILFQAESDRTKAMELWSSLSHDDLM